MNGWVGGWGGAREVVSAGSRSLTVGRRGTGCCRGVRSLLTALKRQSSECETVDTSTTPPAMYRPHTSLRCDATRSSFTSLSFRMLSRKPRSLRAVSGRRSLLMGGGGLCANCGKQMSYVTWPLALQSSRMRNGLRTVYCHGVANGSGGSPCQG